MKRLLLALGLILCFAESAQAQGGSFSDTIFGAQVPVRGGVSVTVCTHPSTVASCPSNKISLFTDITLITPTTNPLTTNSAGQFTVFASPGTYDYIVTGPGVRPQTATQVFTVSGGGGSAAGAAGNVQFNGGGSPAPLGAIPGLGLDSFATPTVVNIPLNLNVNAGGINSFFGYTFNGGAPLNHCLVGNGTFYVDSASCGGGGGGGSPGGTQFATQTNNGSGGFAGINSPGAQGFWFYSSTLPCGTTSAVAPAFVLGGLATRDVQGSTSSDTILCSDQIVNYTSSASTVAVTLPTPTALGNSHFAAKLIDSSVTSGAQVLVGPSGGLTINGASAWPIQQGQSCSLYVDVSGNWGLDCHEPQITLSTGMSGVRSAFGFQLQSSGNLVPQVDGANLVLGAGSVMNFIDAAAFNGLTFTFTLPSPGSGNIQPVIGGTLGNAGLTHSTFTVNGVNTCALGAACVVPPLIVIPNCATGGTSSQLLVKEVDNGSGVACAVTAATTDTSGVIGTCFSGCGTTGSAQVQNGGIAQCIFSNNATDLDYVQISTATAGNCVDAGASRPGSGQILGRVQKTASAGSINVLFVPTI